MGRTARDPAVALHGAQPQALPAMLASSLQRRLAEIGALLLAFAALALLAALVSYNAHDPSLNTATSARPTNLAGPPGAAVADLLLQAFGLAGALPGMALLCWAWRLGSHRGLSAILLRGVALLLALPVLAGVLGAGAGHLGVAQSWPASPGLGGAVGLMLADGALEAGTEFLGPMGAALVWALGLSLAGLLVVLALGLTAREWRAAGRAARGSAQHARTASGVAARAGGVAVAAGTWLLRAVNGTRLTEAPRVVGQDPSPPRKPGEQTPVIQSLSMRAAPPPPAPAVRAVAKILAPMAKIAARPEPVKAAESVWKLPPLDLLTPAPPRSTVGSLSPEEMQAQARLLETVLADYGVQGQIMAIRPGPVVTLYELEPAPGTRAARVIGLADDVARSLSVLAVRVAVVPGRSVLGIEVPNARRETVYLSELIASETWDKQNARLGIALGKDISGAPVLADLARMPHLLVAGTTGSGKSVGINAMILSLLYKLSPAECRLIMIDPKMLELSVYGGIPHLMAPVVTEPAKAVSALKWTVREMERRYRAMSQLSVRNLAGYNERVAEAKARGEVVTRRVQTGFDSETNKPIFEEQPLALETLPLIVVVIDEMADLMMVAGKDIETTVMRLAQMARAAGIHVIMATQRPSVDVITGTIKANFPTRISFRVVSKFDSRTILQEQGAEQLLGQGDMLFQQDSRTTRVHGPFVTDKEVEDVVAFLREQGEPDYLEEITEQQDDSEQSVLSGIAGASDGEKNLFDQAVDIVTREGKASTSFIQRHLQIGYNRAAKLIEQMEKEGIVSPANHVGKREILTRRPSRDDEE
jgi:S-DNA-T family DNA segregation ATPase FtsK/SpoIIIE